MRCTFAALIVSVVASASASDPDSDPNGYATIANEGLVAIRHIFTSMKHDVADNATVSATQLLNPSPARLAEATGVFAFTHGSPPYVQDSGTGLMDAYEVANAVTSRAAGHPPMNFAIYYACSMFAAAATWFNAHFDSATNHFFAGFDKDVLSVLKAGDNTAMLYVPLGKYLTTMNSHLSAHAELFINELKGGKTVFQALVLANTQFPPRGVGSATKDGKGTEYPLLYMRSYGDDNATVNQVYGYQEALESFEQGEPIVETLETWWLTR